MEGQRPKSVCADCRRRMQQALDRKAVAGGRLATRTLCFQCYRADLDRDRALRAAGQVFTGSEARFQEQLPFEPIQEARLATLKAEREEARGALLQGTDRFAHRRQQAVMAARRALQTMVASRPASGKNGMQSGANRANRANGAKGVKSAEYDYMIAAALHAAELQLPDAWLPFVAAR